MTDDAAAIARLERETPPAAELASHATLGGVVDLGSGKKQHVDLYRKLGLRRELLALVDPAGGAFVPFLGEGDIAAELYLDRRIVGIELDAGIAKLAGERLHQAQPDRPDGWKPLIIAGDAEQWHPDTLSARPIAVLDVDAFSNPYRAIETAWTQLATDDHGPSNEPGLADRVAIFGTDGMRLAIRQSKSRFYPSPTSRKLATGTISDKRRQWNNWWGGFILPWLEELVAPATIVETRKYQRTHMVYWGIVVERAGAEPASREERPGSEPPAPVEPTPPDSARKPGEASPADIANVEKALLEAATSGNVAAAIYWLEHKGGPVWTKPPAAATSGAAELLDAMLRPPKRPTRRKT